MPVLVVGVTNIQTARSCTGIQGIGTVLLETAIDGNDRCHTTADIVGSNLNQFVTLKICCLGSCSACKTDTESHNQAEKYFSTFHKILIFN